jgi:hypothetical protein
MSALPPTADIPRRHLDVRKGPEGDKVHRSKQHLLDDLVGDSQ